MGKRQESGARARIGSLNSNSVQWLYDMLYDTSTSGCCIERISLVVDSVLSRTVFWRENSGAFVAPKF
jgi:hypothetical protein